MKLEARHKIKKRKLLKVKSIIFRKETKNYIQNNNLKRQKKNSSRKINRNKKHSQYLSPAISPIARSNLHIFSIIDMMITDDDNLTLVI